MRNGLRALSIAFAEPPITEERRPALMGTILSIRRCGTPGPGVEDERSRRSLDRFQSSG
jgi:hypothetical protein